MLLKHNKKKKALKDEEVKKQANVNWDVGQSNSKNKQ